MGDEKRFHQLQEITLIDARNKTHIFISKWTTSPFYNSRIYSFHRFKQAFKSVRDFPVWPIRSGRFDHGTFLSGRFWGHFGREMSVQKQLIIRCNRFSDNRNMNRTFSNATHAEIFSLRQRETCDLLCFACNFSSLGMWLKIALC